MPVPIWCNCDSALIPKQLRSELRSADWTAGHTFSLFFFCHGIVDQLAQQNLFQEMFLSFVCLSFCPTILSKFRIHCLLKACNKTALLRVFTIHHADERPAASVCRQPRDQCSSACEKKWPVVRTAVSQGSLLVVPITEQDVQEQVISLLPEKWCNENKNGFLSVHSFLCCSPSCNI